MHTRSSLAMRIIKYAGILMLVAGTGAFLFFMPFHDSAGAVHTASKFQDPGQSVVRIGRDTADVLTADGRHDGGDALNAPSPYGHPYEVGKRYRDAYLIACFHTENADKLDEAFARFQIADAKPSHATADDNARYDTAIQAVKNTRDCIPLNREIAYTVVSVAERTTLGQPVHLITVKADGVRERLYFYVDYTPPPSIPAMPGTKGEKDPLGSPFEKM